MKNNKAERSEPKGPKELALYYMKTLVEVARESFLILGPDLKVVSANPTFYKTFRVLPKQTEGKFIYDLGNGQWDIPKLRSLLEEISPKKKNIKNYEVVHVFEKIGAKTMLLNGKQIDSVRLIILAVEDITERRRLEGEMAEYTERLETKVKERTKQFSDKLKELESLNKSMVGRELKMMELKKEIERLKKLVKNGNGKSKNGKNGSSVGRAGNGNHNGNHKKTR
jgi:hypothetical protein